MPDEFDAYERRFAAEQYAREHDDGPTIKHSEECTVCGEYADHTCDECNQSFCTQHVFVARPAARSQIVLAKICDECEGIRMSSEPRALLLDAADHQLSEPFEPALAAQVQQRFSDLLAYGVGEWRRAA